MEFDARSLLFIPAEAKRFIAKGAQRGADVNILDLEDSVAPASKPRANRARLFIQRRNARLARQGAAGRKP